ncbi:MAG: diacylglycerol kinase family protein, partial [Bacteroidota bacterium]
MTKRWKIIANPRAGGGLGVTQRNRLEVAFQAQDIDASWLISDELSRLQTLIEEALQEGFRQFVSVGGDGSLHHLVNALCAQQLVPTQELTIGVIPLGTGNDWIKTHRIPRRLEQAVRVLTFGQRFYQDIGLIQYQGENGPEQRFFCNVAGSGFEAEVVRRSRDMDKSGLKGTFVYLGLVLKTLFSYQCQVHSGDEAAPESALLHSLGICRYNGGGMQLVPEAVPDDGLFDVTQIKALKPWEVIVNLAKLY